MGFLTPLVIYCPREMASRTSTLKTLRRGNFEDFSSKSHNRAVPAPEKLCFGILDPPIENPNFLESLPGFKVSTGNPSLQAAELNVVAQLNDVGPDIYFGAALDKSTMGTPGQLLQGAEDAPAQEGPTHALPNGVSYLASVVNGLQGAQANFGSIDHSGLIPVAVFTKAECDVVSEPLRLCLVGKFSLGKPKLEGLLLISIGAANNKEELKKLNVTHILTVADSLPPKYPNGKP